MHFVCCDNVFSMKFTNHCRWTKFTRFLQSAYQSFYTDTRTNAVQQLEYSMFSVYRESFFFFRSAAQIKFHVFALNVSSSYRNRTIFFAFGFCVVKPHKHLAKAAEHWSFHRPLFSNSVRRQKVFLAKNAEKKLWQKRTKKVENRKTTQIVKFVFYSITVRTLRTLIFQTAKIEAANRQPKPKRMLLACEDLQSEAKINLFFVDLLRFEQPSYLSPDIELIK